MQMLRYVTTLLIFVLMSGCGVLIPASDAEGEWSAVWWITGGAIVIAIIAAAVATKSADKDDDS